MTEENVTESLARLESKLAAMADDLTAVRRYLTALPIAHAAEPEPNVTLHPVFDAAGRDISQHPDFSYEDYRGDYPLLSTCRCGRQIIRMAPGGSWQHCD